MGLCTGYGNVKMSHFGVISQCRINQYVDHLQNLKHLWVEYNQKGARIRCKNDWITTQCKNLNFTQIDPHHCFQADAGNCVVQLKAYFVRTSHNLQLNQQNEIGFWKSNHTAWDTTRILSNQELWNLDLTCIFTVDKLQLGPVFENNLLPPTSTQSNVMCVCMCVWEEGGDNNNNKKAELFFLALTRLWLKVQWKRHVLALTDLIYQYILPRGNHYGLLHTQSLFQK